MKRKKVWERLDRSWHVLLLALLVLAGTSPSRAPVLAEEPASKGVSRPDPRKILERALQNSQPTRREHVIFTNYEGEERGFSREMDLWYERIGDRYRMMSVFTSPVSIRGTAVLILPPSAGGDESDPAADVRPNQYFMYLPAFKNVRRVSGAQRADSFFGTELSRGDVEPHPVRHYRVLGMAEGELQGEKIYELTVEPRYDADFDRSVLTVAKSDAAVLEIRQLENGRAEPVRVIRAPRRWLERTEGHTLPKKIIVEDGRGSGRTVVHFSDRELTDGFADSRFSVGRLMQQGH